ncbi:MAG: DUF3035 domain-containing protein [Rhodobacteraceae bacterium]|nr:DUF3035 domain-containing protein [Paracoccaceae bacterium]
MNLSRLAFLMGLTAALGACSATENKRTLHRLTSVGTSPEEFSIVPLKPLEEPQDYTTLPEPIKGGRSRTDPTPKADVVAALGGNPARLTATGIPASDTALINRTSRFGVTSDIRESLAEADEDFRRRKSLFTWKLIPEDEYTNAYRREVLDGYAELRRFRLLGVRTPAAPPKQGR